MIAFTILGLVVFWWTCFEIGYALGYAAQLLDIFCRLAWLDFRVSQDMSAFIDRAAAQGAGSKEPTK